MDDALALKKYIADNIIHVSQDESQKNYETWAKTFNDDTLLTLGCVIPEEAVKVMKSLKIMKDSVSILDVGAGGRKIFSFPCNGS